MSCKHNWVEISCGMELRGGSLFERLYWRCTKCNKIQTDSDFIKEKESENGKQRDQRIDECINFSSK